MLQNIQVAGRWHISYITCSCNLISVAPRSDVRCWSLPGELGHRRLGRREAGTEANMQPLSHTIQLSTVLTDTSRYNYQSLKFTPAKKLQVFESLTWLTLYHCSSGPPLSFLFLSLSLSLSLSVSLKLSLRQRLDCIEYWDTSKCSQGGFLFFSKRKYFQIFHVYCLFLMIVRY